MLDIEHIMTMRFPAIEHRYSIRDSLLYALSVGYGNVPDDEEDIAFICGQSAKPVPTLGSILAYSSDWMNDSRTGVTRANVVHGEQSMSFHRPLPRDGTAIGQMRIVAISDKGGEKGAAITSENVLRLKGDELPLATIVRTSFCRADGGCGSIGPTQTRTEAAPIRIPDVEVDLRTLPSQALLYRLNGDYNPLHIWPAIARQAGFPQPLLHGLCTYGIACRAILRACCDNVPARLLHLGARFTAPVFPGETIRTLIWNEPEMVRFESWVVERGIRVLGSGIANLVAKY